MDSQTADYWALHLQMETRTGWKMVYQILKDSPTAGTWANLTVKDSPTADYWALHLQMETPTGWKMVIDSDSQTLTKGIDSDSQALTMGIDSRRALHLQMGIDSRRALRMAVALVLPISQ